MNGFRKRDLGRGGGYPVIRDLSVTVLVDDRAANNGLGVEHGFSLWIEADGRKLLFDAGQSDLLFRNAALLGIDPAEADAFILSHGHYDHSGGISRLLAIRPGLPVYCHPGIFIPRYSRKPDGTMKPVGVQKNSAGALMNGSTGITWVSRPMEVKNHIWITGPIPRIMEFEDTGGPFFKDTAGKIADLIEDDIALWLETQQGITVVTGCCHSGIVNTVAYIRQVAGSCPVRRIIGGLHLVNATARRIEGTIGYLQSLDLSGIVPCHCTGDAAAGEIVRRFPLRGEAGHVGKRIEMTFGRIRA